jgi:tetratricopeptide (TPR) repeat protein
MKNQMPAAIECIIRGLYYDPDHLELNFMLGMAHLTINAFPEAIRSFEKVAQINNRYKNNIFLLIGIAHKKKGDIGSAIEALNHQISLNEDA